LSAGAAIWQKEYPVIFKNGGFDVVIGNPPYVRQELLGDNKTYFQQTYQVYHGAADLYTYFIEKGISLLKTKGLFAYIVANKWLRANYGQPLRKWLKKQRIIELADFGDLQVFKGATTYPCILIIEKNKPSSQFSVADIKHLHFSDLKKYVRDISFKVDQQKLHDSGWMLVDNKIFLLLDKLKSKGIPLKEYVNDKIYYGIKTGLNEAFFIDSTTKDKLIDEDKKSVELIKPFLTGKDIKRFCTFKTNMYLILIPRGWTNINTKGVRNKWLWLEQKYPAIANHLKKHEEKAKIRYDKGDYW
jgi:type I restriction-modification system DNA methylase subunit